LVRLTGRHYHHRRHSLHRRPDPDRTGPGQDTTGHSSSPPPPRPRPLRRRRRPITAQFHYTDPRPDPTRPRSSLLETVVTRPESVSDKVRRVRRRRRPRYPANRSCLPPPPRRLNGPPCRRPVMELRRRHRITISILLARTTTGQITADTRQTRPRSCLPTLARHTAE